MLLMFVIHRKSIFFKLAETDFFQLSILIYKSNMFICRVYVLFCSSLILFKKIMIFLKEFGIYADNSFSLN